MSSTTTVPDGAPQPEGEPVAGFADHGAGGTHPVVRGQRLYRSTDWQLRLADAITKAAGSMPFVYAHIVAFAVWMLLVESNPWPTLTLVVSLEAIFLSTFVMIGQNRSAAFAQAKANHDFVQQEMELLANTALTREIHAVVTRHLGDAANPAG